MSKSVLIVDDDSTFRNLVANLLQARGYKTVEASNAQEANSLFSSRDTVLAVVDFRMPGQDGMSWISRLRDSGRNLPVVFVSGTACDAKTFNWLRNILKVSLIIKKPIIPEVFLQQIESLLPADARTSFVIQEGVAQIMSDSDDDAEESQSALLKQLSRLRLKLETKDAVKIAQSNYARELTDNWGSIVKNVNELRQNPGNLDLLNDCILTAHTISGTAGTLGWPTVGESGRKLEHFLRMVDSSPDSSDQEVIWSEVFRVVADGEQAVRAAVASQKPIEISEKSVTKILLVGKESNYREMTYGVTDAHVDLLESAAGASQKLQRSRYDAMVLDFTDGSEAVLCKLASDARAASRQPLPIAVVESSHARADRNQLSYLGCSEILTAPVSAIQLDATIKHLLQVGKSNKHRILLIDDDEVLCQFVSTILTAHGYEVRTLNYPIMATEAIAEFEPDVVLLDVIMPGLTGYEVCRNIRENSSWQNLPILFLTGKTSAESRAAAFQAGANDFLTKPVLTEELLTRINGQLDRIAREHDRLAKDPVTGLLNEDAFCRTALQILEKARHSKRTMTLALLCVDDIDNMRIAQGIEPLRQAITSLGELMLTHFKAEDCRGRLGYDGFTLLAYDETKESLSGAFDFLQTEFLNLKFNGAHGSFLATFSAGLADTNEDGNNFYDLLKVSHGRMLSARRDCAGLINVAG